MAKKDILNLLMIDDNQLYAEELIGLLAPYYTEVNLGFLDDKEELIKLLRQAWDVLIFGNAYDMDFTDAVSVIQNQDIDLPAIYLVDDDSDIGHNEQGMPKIADGNMINALYRKEKAQLVIATCILHDNVTVRRDMLEIKQVLSEAEQRANILIKNSKSAVAYIDQGIHIFANDPYSEMFGFNTPEDLIGVPIIDLIAGGDNIKGFKQFLRRFDKGNRSQVEFKFESKRKDNSTFEAKLQLAAATYDGSPVTQVIIQPDTQSNAAELAKKLAEAARRDSLTGLLNRRGFVDHFDEVYKSAKTGMQGAALLVIRLDDIGKINSNVGIQGVDAAVLQIANLLKAFFADAEVSRFSDSSFMVVEPNVQHQSHIEAKAKDISEKIATMLIEVDNRTITTTVTIGGVLVDATSPEVTKLIDRVVEVANQAYMDSNNVGNVIKFYDASQHASKDDAALAEVLQIALSKSGFQLLYQPIYDIDTDSSHFFEAYVRLPLADGTLMTPDQFIPVAKDYDLIEKIDRWVLINACKQLNKVRATLPDAKVLVQLTNKSLANKQLSDIVGQLVKAIGGDADALTIQFTEQDLVDYMAVAKKQFDAIKANGSRVCIKDFGGTSKTMDLLKYIEPSMVRLTRSYVTDLNKEGNMDVIKKLVSQANEHSTPVLMPYIEDAATMSVAWSVGARYLQGHYLQEPSEQMLIEEGASN